MRFMIGLFTLITFYSFSQNLVPNSGFEEYSRCPNGFNTFGRSMNIPHWFSPTTGTPDYFNECSARESKASLNWAGRCEDFNGKGYAGIITFMDKKFYREYLSVELTQPLDSGVLYFLQFSFRLSSYSKISSGNIGMAFTSEKINTRGDRILTSAPSLVAMPDSAIVSKTGSWQIVSGNYLANGSERFLTIGNFSESTLHYKIKYGGMHEPMLQSASFYYIDDVIVQPEFIPVIPLVLEGDNPFQEDSVIVLKNVQFTYNSSELTQASENELNRLYNFLKNNPASKIEISGHTDDQGTTAYNHQLSLRRAKAVLDYIVGKGIDSNRLAHFGFGKSQPLINSTEEHARSINRRVEVKLVE